MPDDDQGEGQQGNSNSELDQLKSELAKNQKALQAANRQLEDHKKSQLGDVDRLKLESDTYKTQAEKASSALKDVSIRHAVQLAALKAGSHDAEAAAALADLAGVDVDESGKVSGVEAAIERLKKAKPYLFQPQPRPTVGSSGGNVKPLVGATQPGQVGAIMDAMIRDRVNGRR